MTSRIARTCRLVVAGGTATAAVMLGCASPASADWLGAEEQITTGAAIQDSPQLSGARLAYADHTSERTVGEGARTETLFDIRVRDLVSGKDLNLTPNHTALGRPAIAGNRVVWSDYGNGTDRGLWYRNLATNQQRRLDAKPGTQPRLSGELLCYEYRGRIHVYTISTGTDVVVSPQGASASACDISGRIVVWQDVRNGTDADIYAYDLDSRRETRLTAAGTDQTLPRIDAGVVVWQDAISATDSDIYAADLGTGLVTQVTADDAAQRFPDIADGRIVWMDDGEGRDNTEIYLYDLATRVTTRVTRHDGQSGSPTVSGNRIAYEDGRANGHKLYLRTVTPPTVSAAPLPARSVSPQVSGRLLGADGAPVTAETVVVETSADGSIWTPGATAVTDQSGAFTLEVDARSGDVEARVRFAGTPEYPAAVSRSILVQRVHLVAGLARPQP